ncbi:glutathione peroxidase [Candidatus Pelagibacter communis]|uniref:glutathione peroxidase n=1 Tax=Pelagibacter ubique TaxID=198252 RepID=UPI000A5E70AA|nr:glutathione peroxidase [Candidatus Pelagibacter ubique]
MKQIIIGLTILMLFFKNSALANYDKTFFDLEIESINGEIIDFKNYENKVILVVNTASYCGFTKQYTELQELWDKYKSNGLIVLGIPSNSFNQEKSSNSEVKNFCEINFDINFPLSTITEVKGKKAHEIFKWAEKNYGKPAIPKWNFHKILINKEGKIEETFSSFTKPMSKKIVNKIEEIL